MHFLQSSLLSAFVGLTFFSSQCSALFTPPNITASAGQQACASLEKSLGYDKVVTALIDTPSYLNSTLVYYSAQQAANKPACVVVPTQYSDVQTTMKTIRQFKSTMAIKAGGHQTNNYWSSTSGGVLIDFKGMTQKSYDSSKEQGYYQPGNDWGDLYSYYAQYNRVVVGGRISGIGSGLAIGGGLSFLSGEYGLACDSFQSLDVVLADGSLVTATKTNQYSDLLLSIKGGGNQFGIVVGYTVSVYPQGMTWGGLLIYDASQVDAVFQQALNFTNSNKDPKAAVIATLDIIGTPGQIDIGPYSVLQGLDTFVILFNVYDGPDGSAAFEEFTKIPHLLDTRKQQSYVDIENMVEIGASSTGTVTYRTASHSSKDSNAPQTLTSILNNFKSWAQSVKGSYDIVSMDLEPVMASLVEASRAQGGNAQASVDGPYYWINYLHSSLPGQLGVQQAWASLKTTVEKNPNDPTLPIFLNDASGDQPILQSYNAYDTLVKAKAKYDPTGYLTKYMGGPSFTIPKQ